MICTGVPTDAWKIGNLKQDSREEIIRRILEEDIPALNLVRHITLGELAEKYGNRLSDKVFSIEDYKSYLLNCYVEEMLGV